MRRPIRYPVAVVVGLGVALLADTLESGDFVILLAIALVYATTTSLALAHRDRSSGDFASTRRFEESDTGSNRRGRTIEG